MNKYVVLLVTFILSTTLFCLSYADDYTVGEGDVLRIEVFKEKDFSGDFAVDSKGNLNYPVVGDIPVIGRTQEGIRLLLTEILGRDYLVSPKVSVSVKEYKSKRVMVVGSVKKPGVYNLKEKTRILDMITMAGGIEKDGSKRVIVLRRDAPLESKPARTAQGKEVGNKESKIEIGKEKPSEPGAGDGPVSSVDLSSTIEEDIFPSKDHNAVTGEEEKPGMDPHNKDETPSNDVDRQAQEKESQHSAVSPIVELKGDNSKPVASSEELTGQENDGFAPSGIEDTNDRSAAKTESVLSHEDLQDSLAVTSGLTPIVVNFEKILSGEDLSQNIEILGGDIINIPRANEIFVLGSVKKPGPIKYEENMGILQAMTLAGGPTPEASAGSTYILRVAEKGKKEKIKVNFNRVLKHKSKNIQVKPDDVIVVPESFF